MNIRFNKLKWWQLLKSKTRNDFCSIYLYYLFKKESHDIILLINVVILYDSKYTPWKSVRNFVLHRNKISSFLITTNHSHKSSNIQYLNYGNYGITWGLDPSVQDKHCKNLLMKSYHVFITRKIAFNHAYFIAKRTKLCKSALSHNIANKCL